MATTAETVYKTEAIIQTALTLGMGGPSITGKPEETLARKSYQQLVSLALTLTGAGAAGIGFALIQLGQQFADQMRVVIRKKIRPPKDMADTWERVFYDFKITLSEQLLSTIDVFAPIRKMVSGVIGEYVALEEQRSNLRHLRVRTLSDLVARGSSLVNYKYVEAQMRGAEAAFANEAEAILMAGHLSKVIGSVLPLNTLLAGLVPIRMLIEHAIWSKRHDTERRRRGRAVAEFAVAFAHVYDAKDQFVRAIGDFRADEESLFVDERIERLKAIKAIIEAEGHRDEVFDILSLPDEDFVYGLDTLIAFYEKIEAMDEAQIGALVRAGMGQAAIAWVAKVALVVAGAYLIGRFAGVI